MIKLNLKIEYYIDGMQVDKVAFTRTINLFNPFPADYSRYEIRKNGEKVGKCAYLVKYQLVTK